MSTDRMLFWKHLIDLAKKIPSEPDVFERLVHDPANTLQEFDADIDLSGFVGPNEPHFLSEIMQNMTDQERRATASALVGLAIDPTQRVDAQAVAGVVAIVSLVAAVNAVLVANVVQAANANANVNANANMNANVNGAGGVALHVVPTYSQTVQLPTEPQPSLNYLYEALEGAGYNELRRKALFKFVLTSVDAEVSRTTLTGKTIVTAKYIAKGISFELSGEITPEKIAVISGSLID